MTRRPGIWFLAGLAVLPPAITVSAVQEGFPAQGPRTARGVTREPTALEQGLLNALAREPATAPYHFSTDLKNGRIVLKGRVGTKLVHDVAIRVALDITTAIDDELIIDTAAIPVDLGAVLGPVPPIPGRPGIGPGMVEAPPWVTDPWWAIHSDPRVFGDLGFAPFPPAPPNPRATEAMEGSRRPIRLTDTVEMTIDPRGVAVLRGTVSTWEERAALGRGIAGSPGVSEVVNQLQVQAPVPLVNEDQPPPPPEAVPPPTPSRSAPVEPVTDLAGQVQNALGLRPALRGAAIQAAERQGTIVLTGRVPSAYEAMIAFRAAQKTPGVRAVQDRLDFPEPLEGAENPLLARGRPEDIEPYLTVRIRGVVGSEAHIDRLRLLGDRLTIVGDLADETARDEVEARVRAMPILRGIRLEFDLRGNGAG